MGRISKTALLWAVFTVSAVTVHAAEIPIDAISSVAGSAENSEYMLGMTVGLPIVGISTNTGYEETVGFWHWWNAFASDVPVDPFPGSVPTSTFLAQNFPNPFRFSTQIRFQVAAAAGENTRTRLEVFDVSGRRVSTLVDDSLAPGFYEATLVRADSGLEVIASGIYFARLIAGEYRRTIRLVTTK